EGHVLGGLSPGCDVGVRSASSKSVLSDLFHERDAGAVVGVALSFCLDVAPGHTDRVDDHGSLSGWWRAAARQLVFIVASDRWGSMLDQNAAGVERTLFMLPEQRTVT